MIITRRINHRAILFIIPNEEVNSTWKIEKYFRAKEDFQLCLRRITKDQTTIVSYRRAERYFINEIVEQYPDDSFWESNIVYLLTGDPPPGKSILLGDEQGQGADSIMEL